MEEPRKVEITEEDYKNYLNNAYEAVTIGSSSFDPGDVLETMDPIAFNIGFHEYELDMNLWECPVCGEEWDSEEQAKYCCQEDEDGEEKE